MTNLTHKDENLTRLHHFGCVVRDQAKTRYLMEEVLGFPLVATWIEKSRLRELDEEHVFCHTFYALGDGSALAFFQFADPTMFEKCQAPIPPIVSRFEHLALKVSTAKQDVIKQNLTAASIPFREIDHGYCRSLYINTADGLELEFAVDPEDLDQILGFQRAHASSDLDRWIAGDVTPNNTLRHRE
ncbi:VOC family protein [Pseudomonas sp. W5-36]|uniref:VOC family protein n=1 Tax=Pseudomonas sp. W5-36 TaxID=3097455 RepID=UPI0039799713